MAKVLKGEEGRVTTPEKTEDDTLEASLRPKRLADFVGQEQARDNLSVFIAQRHHRPGRMYLPPCRAGEQ